MQAQILNLLEDMKQRYGLTLVFIAHDLAVVKNVSDRVAVMYLGKLCEMSAPDVSTHEPAHPYTSALLDAIPVPDPTVDAGGPNSRVSSPLPWRRRRDAGSGPDAPVPRACAPTSSRRCARSASTTTWPVTSRWWKPRNPTRVLVDITS